MTLNYVIMNLSDDFTVAFPCIVVRNGIQIFCGSLGELSANLSLCSCNILDSNIPYSFCNNSKCLLFNIA